MTTLAVKEKKESSFTLSEIKDKYFPQWDLHVLSAKTNLYSHSESAYNLVKPSPKKNKNTE